MPIQKEKLPSTDSSFLSVGTPLGIHNVIQYNLVCTGSNVIHLSNPAEHIPCFQYNGPPVKTTHEIIIVNQIIPYQPILSPEPPCYRSAQRNCPAEQGCLDRLGLAGTMALARCPQLLNPLRTLAAAAQPARTRLSRSMACDAKQLW